MTLFERISPLVTSSFLDETSIYTRQTRPNSMRSSLSVCSSHVSVVLPRINKSVARDEAKGAKPLEPDEKEHRRLVSFAVIYTMIFFNGCCFTAVVPSVPFYLQILNAPPAFLGWVVSFYSLGQILGSQIAGWLSNKLSSRRLLMVSSALGLLSSALYAVAPGYWSILLSRSLTGISAGMEFTTELTFIATNTAVEERTTFLASVTASNVLGFIMGPALGTLLALLDIEILGLAIDQHTGPGWLLGAMFLLDLFMIQYLFKEDELCSSSGVSAVSEPTEQVGLLGNTAQSVASYRGPLKEHSGEDSERLRLLGKREPVASYGGILEERSGEESDNTDHGSDVKEPPPSLPLILSLIFVQFTVMCGFSVLETITSPLARDEFDWDVRDCNLLFTCSGLVSLVAYFALVVASKRVQDRWLVLCALVLCVLGFLLAIDWQQLDWVPRWVTALLPPYLERFLVGFMVMNAGFMTGRPITFAIYSKLIAPQYQGKFLGWMVAGGSAARTLGPFAAVSLYYGVKGAGANLLALFGSVEVFYFVCLVLVLLQWSKLLPWDPELQSFNTTTTSTTNEDEDEEPMGFVKLWHVGAVSSSSDISDSSHYGGRVPIGEMCLQ